MTYEKIYDIVKKKFAHYPKRFSHMEGVVNIALDINHHLDLQLDDGKVKLAALLHDYAKINDPKELEEVIKKEYQGQLQQAILEVPPIHHAFAGGYFVRRDFNINDPDILEAVVYHTTGKVGMGLLSQLIFVSDYIEEGRTFEESKIVRSIAYKNLDAATFKILEFTIKKVQTGNQKLFWGTEEIYRYYQERMRLLNWNY